MEFRKWESIKRVNTSVVITEKIDGTNGIIGIDETGKIWAGSRTRWLTETADNYGFYKWVMENETELKRMGEGYHYGEWYGKGIQRGYGLDHRRFALFNVGRWKEWRPECCETVPVLYSGEWAGDTIGLVAKQLREGGSVAVPGFTNPEGLVVYHNASSHLFKYIL